MLEKPDLQDRRIMTCLDEQFGLSVAQVSFLPLGADRDTAVYRIVADDEIPYFLKLRRGDFDRTSVALPRFFSDQGIEQIISPLTTKSGQLWGDLDEFRVILYPYVEGRNGYERDLSDRHWVELGTALKSIHTATVPPALLSRIRHETYTPTWREMARMFLERAEDGAYDESLARRLVVFLNARRDEISELIGRAERLARDLQARSPEFVVCHSDLHAGNVLIDADDALYIVDWDEPILAPKERDLMFVGGAQGFSGHTAQEEAALFYQGYGQTQIDPVALAYYRYERIVQDIALFCEQILLTDGGGKDREQSFHYLTSNFLPNGTIEIAYKSDKTLRDG